MVLKHVQSVYEVWLRRLKFDSSCLPGYSPSNLVSKCEGVRLIFRGQSIVFLELIKDFDTRKLIPRGRIHEDWRSDKEHLA